MKNSRQQKILELIEKYDIETQEQLIARLNEAGFSVTQTTVSRDINQLKLVKTVSGSGRYKYVLPEIRRDNNVSVVNSALSEACLKIQAARNIVVVKTLSGMANAIAVCIDSIGQSDILGSVAGDDTILIVLTTDEAAQSLSDKLHSIFGVNG